MVLASMKSETSFEVELERQLSAKQFSRVLQSLRENESFVEAHTWNIINTVCLTLKSKQLLETDSDLEMCKSILLHLADRGKPKEVIVALMEEADSFKSHEYFCLLLEPLKHTLMKVPGKRGKSLEWVLSTLNAHIQTMQLPQDLDLQGKEKLLLDADPAVVDANFVLSGYLQFVEAFVDEVRLGSDCYLERALHQRDILQKFVLMLLDRPFLYHDLQATDPKSTIRTLCERYVSCLAKICANVFNLFRFEHWKVDVDSDDCEGVPQLALANLAYLTFVEGMAADFRPLVHSQVFLLKKHLKYVILLLGKKENLVLFKGLHLADALLASLDDLAIAYELVDLEEFMKFPKRLLNLAIFSQIRTHRTMAVDLFQVYVAKCDWKGRYHILLQALLTSNHSGAESLAISCYKKYLNECLCGRVDDSYFLGNNLKFFLKKTFTLKDGVETDLLENSDKIMAALNFLRYLLLKDKRDKNVTGIWNMLDDIVETFVEPLRKGLDLSRAHYKQVRKDHEEAGSKLCSTVTVNNETISNMPRNLKKEVLQKALLAFDMMESVISRLQELF